MPLVAVLENYNFVDDSQERLNSENLNKLAKPLCRIAGQEDQTIWLTDGSKVKGGVTNDKIRKNTVYGKSVDVGKFAFVDVDADGNKYWRMMKSNSDGTRFIMIKNGLPYFQRINDPDDPIFIRAESLRPEGEGYILAVNHDKIINGHPTLVWIKVYDSDLSYSFFHPGERQTKEAGKYIINASSSLLLGSADPEYVLEYPFNDVAGAAIRVDNVFFNPLGVIIYIYLGNPTELIFNGSSGTIMDGES